MGMGMLEECLCVVAGNKETFEVWVMQDYGVPDSWNKLYSINKNDTFTPYQVLGPLTNGEILCNSICEIVLYMTQSIEL